MNDRFVWDNGYSVGVKLFDDQHKNFFNIVNEILDFIDVGSLNNERLLELATKLGNYAVYHLNSEEQNFHKYDYAHKDAHIAVHDHFREKSAEYLQRINSDYSSIIDVATEMANFSMNWLIKHIIDMDKEYTEFFEDKEIVE